MNFQVAAKTYHKIWKTGCLILVQVLCFCGMLDAFEHPRYEIKASVDVEKKNITSEQRVTFTNNSQQPVEELYFHIYPHRKYSTDEKKLLFRYAGYFKINPFPEGFSNGIGSLTIQSVQHAGQDLSFQVEGKQETLLKINLRQKLFSGESVEVSIAFDVSIPHAYGRFGWHENIMQLSRWYPILAVHNDEGWNKNPFYVFHRPFFSEASYYDVELTVPEEYVVVHSADFKHEEAAGSGVKTLSIETSLPIREFTVAMSPDYLKQQVSYNGMTINSFYLKGDEFFANQAVKSVKDLMDYYSQIFGGYLYKTFNVVPVYLGYGGEQMSNMAFIDTRMYKLPKLLVRYFDFLIAHETGHQWFYNTVGMNEFSNMWLEEGLNSFFTLEYLEKKYGRRAEIPDYPDWFKEWEWLLPELTFRKARVFRYMMITRIGFDNPVVGELSSFREPSTIFSLTYGKGARIVEMLKTQLGEKVFAKVFERIFKEFAFQNLGVKDFIAICEQESSQDLGWFFDQWLYSDQHFDYAVGGVKGGRITLENRGGIQVPVDITVRFSDGSETVLRWNGQRKKEALVVDLWKKIIEVHVDEAEQWLDIDRTNNHWPRKVDVKLVPIYLGLYDIPVFQEDDAYNLIFGPDVSGGGLGVKASLQKPYDQSFYVGTDYDFGEALHHSRLGYQLKNLFSTQTVFGVEASNTHDLDGGEEDLASGKVYLRRELWPAQYGLVDINDHITFYLLRNQRLNDYGDFLSGEEDARNIEYRRRKEAIVGTSLHLNRSGPYPDPIQGYKVDALLESAGHFLGAEQYFYRASVDVSLYHPVTAKTQFALRLKYGKGYPDDKDLFKLGGINGLRGYGRKTIRGASALLGSLEYRFPIFENIGWGVLDNILRLESVGGVAFFDAGQAWFEDFEDTKLRKDAGFGLRFTINVGASLEKVIVRADVARAINDSSEDTRFWFSIGHSF
ncbi:MAG: BamA/TamA family outer membrane protein [Candidatus Omnitrophica bacterium]|nr:BamA/TamA family outer membrane protein [Candidatus Omnitrophota bacterium]